MPRSLAVLVLLTTSAAGAQQAIKSEQDSPTPIGESATRPPPEFHPAVRLGGMVGVLTVPRPVSAEVYAHFFDLLGVGLAFSTLPAELSGPLMAAANVNASLTSSALDLDLRLYPFRGSFFVGSALGRQTLSAFAARFGHSVSVDMRTIYATPRLGWMGIWDSGVSLSFDAGVQLPLMSGTNVQGADPDAVNAAQSAARTVGGAPLPVVGLRLGFFL
jgi:hypothetical protein